MPRVPLYESNRIGPVETTGARFQAARDRGNIGQAVSRLGQAGNEDAIAQDKLDEQFDDTFSRRLMLDYQKGAAAIKTEYEALEGMAAVEARKDADERIKKLYGETMGRASNDRMRNMTSLRIDGLFAEDGLRIGSHAVKQLNVETDKTQLAQIEMASESAAANWSDPKLLDAHINTGVEVLNTFGARKGWTEDRIKNETDKFRSGIHKSVVSNFLVDDDVDGAEAYLEANADELLWSDELSLRADLKTPLENRQAYQDYQTAIGMIEIVEGEATPSAVNASGPAGVIANGLRSAGMSEHVVAGFLGNFKHESDLGQNKNSGDGGTAHGLAQWRFERVSNFKRVIGKHPKDASLEEQAKFVAWEMKNPGAAGMTTAQRDKILNAKSAEEAAVLIDRFYERSDGKSRGERAASAKEYVGAGGNAPRLWDKAQVYSKIEELAEKEGWSFERTERAKARADFEIQRDEQLLAREEDQAARAANEIVIGLGDRFTDISMIPLDKRMLMAPEDVARLTDVAARNAAPKSVPANGDAQLALNLMRIHVPEKFKEENLGQWRGTMTPAEFDTLVQQQATLRAEKPEKYSPRTQISSTIAWGEKYGGLGALEDQDRIAIYDIMDNLVSSEYRKTGKAPTEEQYVAALRLATKQYTTVKRGAIWGSKGQLPVYKLTVENIPASEKAAMIKAYKAQYDKEPTDEQLTKMFRMKRAGK